MDRIVIPGKDNGAGAVLRSGWYECTSCRAIIPIHRIEAALAMGMRNRQGTPVGRCPGCYTNKTRNLQAFRRMGWLEVLLMKLGL